MSNKKSFNKNSKYVQSLVDFILDTKPYHSKLTEIVEENQFFDDVNVSITERLLIKTKMSATWTYNYYSSGNSAFRTMPLQRVVAPYLTLEQYESGTQENIDMASVPYVYSKKRMDGGSANDVLVMRGAAREPMLEGHDFFQSKGSFQFQIKQTRDANDAIKPRWVPTNIDTVVSTANATVQANALDITNPNSAISKISDLLQKIGNIPNLSAEALTALDDILAIVAMPNLPYTYEPLLNQLVSDGTPIEDLNSQMPSTDQFTWWVGEDDGTSKFVDDRFEQLSPSLARYYGVIPGHEDDGPVLTSPVFSDAEMREVGDLVYDDTLTAFLSVTNIVPNLLTDYEEWTLSLVSGSFENYKVTGSVSGHAGFVLAGTSFSTNRISFDTTDLGVPPNGATVKLVPHNKLVIHPDAPLETWNLIKVNPIAYTRPALTSTRYGYIQDAVGTVGSVTILNETVPTGTIVLTAISPTTFAITSTVDSGYTGTAVVGAPFNDGSIAFTIMSGSAVPFSAGDKFFIEVENKPPETVNLDLGFGYDLDSYDNPNLVYDTSGNINFAYDTRFTDYDMTALNLSVAQNAVSSRQWRIIAKPNGAPIATIKKDGSGPINSVDLQEATSGISPDPALTAPPLYNMAGDSHATHDIELYYADSFIVQYSDDNFNTVTNLGEVLVGDTFTSLTQGISFTLAPGSKPFIAVMSDDGSSAPSVHGGDVFSFSVINNSPVLTSTPIGLTSNNIARLIMHGDGFFDTPAASWTVAFTSANEYTVSAVDSSSNVIAGTPLAGTLVTSGIMPNEGLSFKGAGVHFTVVPGTMGLASGDTFTFRTFEEKPTFLVHGSVTGYTGTATVGKYFWNGKIGFTIPSPTAMSFEKVGTNFDITTSITIDSIRVDCPSLMYELLRTANGYMVSRSDKGAIGHMAFTAEFNDEYITFSNVDNGSSEIRIKVSGQPFEEWNAQDVIILNPTSSARLPLAGDTVLVQKAENETLSISLTPGFASLTPLNPLSIDQRFIDLDTNSSIPLSNTSPDTAILQGWLPMFVEKYDSASSVAEFSDTATTFIFKSAGTGLPIGTLKQQGAGLNEPIVFEWDSDFYNTYLPLNAEANIVLRGGGLDDRVRAHITESVKFLIDGGPLAESFMFNDNVNINLDDTNIFRINATYGEDINVAVQDGPFGGFLPGYANTPYDDFGYDTGQPPDIYSMLARYNLSSIDRDTILDQWNFYLDSNQDAPTTEAQWQHVWAMLEPYNNTTLLGDPAIGVIGDDFGYPAVGLAIDINQSTTSQASASFQEAMVMTAADSTNLHDVLGYDVGGIDDEGGVTAFMYSGSLPPVPTPLFGTTYSTLDTPLTVEGNGARTFVISFNAAPSVLASMPTPTFMICTPTNPTLTTVPAVETVQPGKYRFSVAQITPAKIIVS